MKISLSLLGMSHPDLQGQSSKTFSSPTIRFISSGKTYHTLALWSHRKVLLQLLHDPAALSVLSAVHNCFSI